MRLGQSRNRVLLAAASIFWFIGFLVMSQHHHTSEVTPEVTPEVTLASALPAAGASPGGGRGGSSAAAYNLIKEALPHGGSSNTTAAAAVVAAAAARRCRLVIGAAYGDRKTGPRTAEQEDQDQERRERQRQPRWRCLPDYLGIGFPKCGSSSLWRYLGQHSQVGGVFFFSLFFFS